MSTTTAIEGAIASATAEETPAGAPDTGETLEVGENEAELTTSQEDEQGVQPTPEEQGKAAPTGENGEVKKEKKRYLPYDRHEAVLANTRKDYEKQLQEVQSRYQPYESEGFRARLAAIDLAEKHPEAFLAILKKDERFAALLSPPKPDETPKDPDPDGVLADGSLGYTAETVKKLVQSYVDRAVTQTRNELQKTMEPIVASHQDRVAMQNAEARLAPVLEDARQNWPDFQANEGAIRQVFMSDKRHTLDSAYRTFMSSRWGNFEAQRETIREEERKKLLEQTAKKKEASAASGSKTPSASGGTRSGDRIEDAIRNAIAQSTRV